MTILDYPDTETLDLSGATPVHPVLPHAIIYTKPGCVNCGVVKRRSAANGLPLIEIDVADNETARDFIVGLGAATSPVVIAHNVFTEPVWFAGGAPDQLRYLHGGYAERLTMLEASGDIEGADAYIAALGALCDTETTSPALSMGDYLDMAHQTLAVETPVRYRDPVRLQSERRHNPSVLLTAQP